MGKVLIIIGVVFILVGFAINMLPKDAGLPRLPGDIYIKKEGFTFYFPWVTSILVSALLSLIFYLFFRK